MRLALRTPRKVSQDDYAGSIVKLPSGKELLILNPLYHLVAKSESQHLFSRYLSKLTAPERWFKQCPFTWEIGNVDTLPKLFEELKSCRLISVDIETGREKPHPIKCCGFTGVWIEDGRIRMHTIVLPFTEMAMVHWARKFADLEVPKIFQNGGYDNAYLLCYGIVMRNWFWDTQHIFHSWLAELPKRLDFITIYALRNVEFWKDEANSAKNLEEFYRYNARDCWATANALLSLLSEIPYWAKYNYHEHEFPMVFPSLSVALDGLRVDPERQKQMEQEQLSVLDPKLQVSARWWETWNSIHPLQFKSRDFSMQWVVEIWTQRTSKHKRNLQIAILLMLLFVALFKIIAQPGSY